MRQELVPEIVGERFTDNSHDGKKVRFGGTDGLLGGIAPVHIRGHRLVICFPLLPDGAAILLAGLILQDLEVNFVAALFDAHVYVVVCQDAMLVVFGLEGIYKDEISVAVVSQHDM